jgi:hypothetical protein
MAAMVAMAAIALLMLLWAKAMAHPLLHLEQRSPLLGKYCSSDGTVSFQQFQACYPIVSNGLERFCIDVPTWCSPVSSHDWISEGSYIDAWLQSTVD